MTALIAYIGRDNEERLELLNDGSLVTAGAVTRAVFKFGSWCLDTDEHPALIGFTNGDKQTLWMKLGLVPALIAGKNVSGLLTIYDAVNTNGLAWGNYQVAVKAWPGCSA